MSAAAEGKVYARYTVSFTVVREGEDARIRTGLVALTTGYTTFEDIRKILSMKHGGGPDNIHVISMVEEPL